MSGAALGRMLCSACAGGLQGRAGLCWLLCEVMLEDAKRIGKAVAKRGMQEGGFELVVEGVEGHGGGRGARTGPTWE